MAPSRPVTSSGKISSAKLPSSMPATARWCERSAQASISSRVTPASTAAFQPDRDGHVEVGRLGRSRWVGDIQSSQSSVPGIRRVARGEVDEECAPPATTTRSMPARIEAAAVGDRGEPGGAVAVVGHAGHVIHAGLDGGVAGDVAPAVERLAEDDVVDEGGIDAGAAHASATARVPSSKASTSTSEPLNAVPIAVRAVDTTTASAIGPLRSRHLCPPSREAYIHIARMALQHWKQPLPHPGQNVGADACVSGPSARRGRIIASWTNDATSAPSARNTSARP